MATLPPRIVYHGTEACFEAFAPNERGLFFAESYRLAASFSGIRKAGAPRVIAAALDISNPWTSITYGDDVPYRDQVDQSPAAIEAQGFDGIYMPASRVWIALRPNQVSVIDPNIAREGFVPNLRAALDEWPGAAQHFARSGAWGMALALYEAVGGMLVVPAGARAPFVRTASATFDWRGHADLSGGYPVMREDLIREAVRAGLTPAQLEEDRERAIQCIELAREMSLIARAEKAPCEIAAPQP
ncbi:hypothetical protein [Variovorax gossypii]|jgi:hypothetical protein|uniref:hypothetical protein n=1 Tax=uncultured Variovorax sp. TaxID=114708 RepID=UPI00261D8620|nr:hypothetical protein [uncultured Variovorax sp.]